MDEVLQCSYYAQENLGVHVRTYNYNNLTAIHVGLEVEAKLYALSCSHMINVYSHCRLLPVAINVANIIHAELRENITQ